jgi:hypothetical protein
VLEAINPLDPFENGAEAGGQGGWVGGVHHEVKIPAVRRAWRMDDHAEGGGEGSEEGSEEGSGSGEGSGSEGGGVGGWGRVEGRE